MTAPLVEGLLTLPFDPALFTRDHNRFLRASFVDGADFHHQHHIKRHFEPFAGAKYGYQPRSRKYNAWKRRKYGEAVDLVKTGETRAVVTTQRQITATPKGAKLTMRLP